MADVAIVTVMRNYLWVRTERWGWCVMGCLPSPPPVEVTIVVPRVERCSCSRVIAVVWSFCVVCVSEFSLSSHRVLLQLTLPWRLPE